MGPVPGRLKSGCAVNYAGRISRLPGIKRPSGQKPDKPGQASLGHLMRPLWLEFCLSASRLSWYDRGKPKRKGLQLGFAACTPNEIRRGVRDLAIALEDVRKRL
jgi:hypothetical protein